MRDWEGLLKDESSRRCSREKIPSISRFASSWCFCSGENFVRCMGHSVLEKKAILFDSKELTSSRDRVNYNYKGETMR